MSIFIKILNFKVLLLKKYIFQNSEFTRTQSEERDFNDENSEQVVDKSISKTNNISSNSESLDFSDTLKDSLMSQDITKASTPIKTDMNDAKMCSPKELER